MTMLAYRSSNTATNFIRGSYKVESTSSNGMYGPSTNDFLAAYLTIFRRWQDETSFFSDPDRIKRHPAYIALVRYAEDAFPAIMSELRQRPSFLVWVLNDALGSRDGTPKGPGNLRQLSEEWVRWGAQHDAFRGR